MTSGIVWRTGSVAVIVLIVAAVLALPSQAQHKMGNGKSLSIEGSYIFVSRDIPAGSTTQSTNVEGMMTFTKQYRNFNISWEEPGGKHRSLAIVAEYKLTPESYQETPIYFMSYDDSQGGASYAVPTGFDKPSTVTLTGGKMTIPFNGEGVTVTFDGNTMTAVSPGQFTDHWKRVN